MCSMKKDNVNDRVEEGNAKANYIAKYVGRRTGVNLVCSTPKEDKQDKIDFRDPKTNKTFQVKCRDSGSGFDIIHEHQLFNRETQGVPITKNTKWLVTDGRDAICKADLFVVKPVKLKKDSKEKIYIVKTKDVNQLCDEAVEEWLKSIGKTEVDDALLYELWCNAENTHNKQQDLITAKNGVNVRFKIDEGQNRKNRYAKILCFVPPSKVEEHGMFFKKLELRDGESLYNESTWRNEK